MNRFLFLLIFIFLIVAGWSGAWIFISSQITDKAEELFLASSNQGQQLDCAQLDIAGFPFRFDVTCTDLTLRQDDLNIYIPEIKATVLAYRPTHALFFAKGPVQIIDSFTGSSREITWNSLSASLRTNGWALVRASLEAKNIQLNDTIFGRNLVAALGDFEAHLINNENFQDEMINTRMYDLFVRMNEAQAPEFDVKGAQIELEAILEDIPNDIRNWSLGTISKNWFEQTTGLVINKLEGSDHKSRISIVGSLSTTVESMLTGNFDFYSTNLANRFQNLMSDFERDTVFGLKSDDGSHYQSYSFLHGIVLAGNAPILATVPLI